jgi:ribosome modulation factor
VTDPNSDIILATQMLGAKSYQAGVSGRDNPYQMSANEDLCIAWIRGFNMARTERAREIERAT